MSSHSFGFVANPPSDSRWHDKDSPAEQASASGRGFVDWIGEQSVVGRGGTKGCRPLRGRVEGYGEEELEEEVEEGEEKEEQLKTAEVLNCRFHSRSLQQLHADQRRRPLDKRLSRRWSEGRATAVQL
ncbi:unnamed protein product [Gadus morhua 'NCC']